MAVVTQFKSSIPSIFPAAPAPTPEASTYRPHSAEAPDRGYTGEAREARSNREAPDAGEGRSGYMENEYTHGRSQS